MSEKEPKSLEVSEKDQDISVQNTNDTKTEKEISESVSNDIEKERNDKSNQEKDNEETDKNYNDDDIELTAHDLHPAYRDLEIPFQNKEDFVPSNARTNFNESKHLDEDWVPERSVCQKDMKKLDKMKADPNISKSNIVISILGIICGVLFIFLLILASNSGNVTRAPITIKDYKKVYEIGDTVSLKIEDFVDFSNSNKETKETASLHSPMFYSSDYEYDSETGVIKTKGMNYLDAGNYELTVQYQEDGHYKSIDCDFKVVDSIAPQFVDFNNNVYILKNATNVNFLKYYKCKDNSGYSAISVSGITQDDLKKTGTYKVTVTAKDKSGNKQKRKGKIHVVSRFLVDNGNAVLTPMTDGYIPDAPYSASDYEEDDDSKVSEKETSKKDEIDKDDGWKGTRYYKDGTMLTGLQTVDDNVYYFSDFTGEYATGWLNVYSDAQNYYRMYFKEDGKRASGLTKIDGHEYYFDPDTGDVRTGWIYTKSKTEPAYYAGSDGIIISKGSSLTNKEGD